LIRRVAIRMACICDGRIADVIYSHVRIGTHSHQSIRSCIHSTKIYPINRDKSSESIFLGKKFSIKNFHYARFKTKCRGKRILTPTCWVQVSATPPSSAMMDPSGQIPQDTPSSPLRPRPSSASCPETCKTSTRPHLPDSTSQDKSTPTHEVSATTQRAPRHSCKADARKKVNPLRVSLSTVLQRP